MANCNQVNFVKSHRTKKRATNPDTFYRIPGFSYYSIAKDGRVKDLFNHAIIAGTLGTKFDKFEITNDNGKKVKVDVIFLLSQMAYGPNAFPLYEIDDPDFTSEDVKVSLIECLRTFKYISPYEVEICGQVFRQYQDTPLYITKWGNVFNAATGMIIKTPQHNGYYYLPKFYGQLRIQRMVYDTWVKPLEDHFVIDHVNCRPWDNWKGNLDAVDMRENTRRAIRNSCKDYIMHWDTAVAVCKDLAYPDPMTPQEVSDKYDLPIHVPRFIVQGITWKEICEEYNLVYPDYNLRKPFVITSEMHEDALSMDKKSFGEKYRFGGRKLEIAYKQART